MRLVVILILSLALLLSPIYAALPDNPLPLWESWLTAGTFTAAAIALFAAWRGSQTFLLSFSRAEQAFLVLLGLAFLSILARLIAQHGTGYSGGMLRGWATLATYAAAFALARRVARERVALYGLALAAVLASGYIAEQGVLEDLPFLLKHLTTWRVFGTSTPDYLAGYLVMLLPLTLALFLQMPSLRLVMPLARNAATALFGLILLMQLATLVATGSRFALVSLAVGLVVFGIALKQAQKHGQTLDRATRRLLVFLGIGLVLAVLVFAKPVFLRLSNPDPNSGAFRVWTWKGAARMAAANPVLGTGVGTWEDLYPRYAVTGFTRAAHSSYLQIADECGFPALAALLAALGLLGFSLMRGLKSAPIETPGATIQAAEGPPQGQKSKRPTSPGAVIPPKLDYLPTDHRLLLCGLLAALAGGIVQNLIDSDWYVFFLGFTFWTFAGLAAAAVASPKSIADLPEASIGSKAPRLLLLASGSVAVVFATLTAAQGIGTLYAGRAQEQIPTDPQGAAQNYASARAWDPLNDMYASDQGYKVLYSRLSQLTEAETALRVAVALRPNSVNFRKLGNVLQQNGRQSEAQTAYETGLRADPHSLDLLLNLARLSPSPGSLDYYRRLSDLELTPVGTVRALSEYVETRFGIADAVMGDEAAKANPAQAIGYYVRAAHNLEQYADGNGSENLQQRATHGDKPDPQKDTALRGLYEHVMAAWIALVPEGQRDTLRQRQEKYGRIYDTVIAQSSK